MKIDYGRTAIKRNKPSTPMKFLVENGYIEHTTAVFDWGHGRGDDMQYLLDEGFTVDGFDPYHQTPSGFYGLPPEEVSKLDVRFTWVYLGYVLNVLESVREREKILRRVKNFLPYGGTLSVAVRPAKEVEGSITKKWKPFNDGWITSTNTFQKGFFPFELCAMLTDAGFDKVWIVKSEPLIALAVKRVEENSPHVYGYDYEVY